MTKSVVLIALKISNDKPEKFKFAALRSSALALGILRILRNVSRIFFNYKKYNCDRCPVTFIIHFALYLAVSNMFIQFRYGRVDE